MNSIIAPHTVMPGYRLKEDEYLDSEGIIYCKTCKSPRQCRTNFCGRDVTVYALCKCKAEKWKKSQEEQAARMRREEIERNRSIGLTDPNMENHTFENDLGYNATAMKIAKNYVAHWQQCKKDGHGLIFWGSVGTGKSYIADCIGNALLDKGVRVLITNFSRLLNRLMDFDVKDKNGIIQDLNSYELLILDDFGIERDSEYAREQVYNIIDSRYRSGLPMIVTTNLTIKDMRQPTDFGRYRIYDRVLGKNTPVAVEGQNIRKLLGEDEKKRYNKLFAPESGA